MVAADDTNEIRQLSAVQSKREKEKPENDAETGGGVRGTKTNARLGLTERFQLKRTYVE